MNILLTSSGRRTYLVKYFKEALNGDGLIHASNSEPSVALQEADKSIITPMINDPDYIDFLINYCNENEINAIVPLLDLDLPILAKSKESFRKEGINLIVSDLSITEICNDKWLSYMFFKENNFDTPKTYLDPKNVIEDLNKSKIQFPLIVKPRWGMGSIGIFTIDDMDEFNLLIQKSKREIFNSYLKFESNRCEETCSIRCNEKCIVIQEKLTGDEFGLDVLNDLDGRYVKTFVKRKFQMRSGETDGAETINNQILSELGKKIGTKLGHAGNLDVDYFCCDSKYYILEMNCRFGGGYPFTHLAGVNLPKVIIYWLKNEKVPDTLLEMKYNVVGWKDINPIIFNHK